VIKDIITGNLELGRGFSAPSVSFQMAMLDPTYLNRRSKFQQRFYRTNLSIGASAMMYSLTFPDGDHWREAWSPSMMATVAV
jgi:hypothetical protein